MFSIIIPTWNNLPYLKQCVDSIQRNSFFRHQVILHINEGNDGTRQWVTDNGFEHTSSPRNEGICKAVNQAAMLAVQDYIVYMNDDMYVCPDWDKYLAAEIDRMDTDCFMLSATMIEPVKTNNNCVIVENFGATVETFREADLLEHFERPDKKDWNGATWPPTLVAKKYWFLTGGYSIELSPGLSSDDDFSMKMWQAGCRIYKGVGKSRVYHFQTRTTSRVKKNNGRKQFLFKWGINQSTFNKYFLRRGSPFSGPLSAPPKSVLRPELLRAWVKMRFLNNTWGI